MDMVMEFSRMCDRCFKTVSQDETLYAFSVWDDKGEVRVLKGHSKCVEEMRELFKNEGIELEGESL